MKMLPNGLTVFNSTPHSITFWCEDWGEPVEVECDQLINASVTEVEVDMDYIHNATSVEVTRYAKSESDLMWSHDPVVWGTVEAIKFVKTEFAPNIEGWETIEDAYENGADVVIGSIIAAQAYPGKVFAMTPAPGYERVAPTEKRMNPDKFTVFTPLPSRS